jgi:Hint module
MTQNHVLPSGTCGSSPLPLIYASEVSVGDCVMTVSGEEKVSMVEKVQGEGVYTIVTNEEYVVVNGVIASPFGANHMMANLYYNIHRFLYSLSPVLLASNLLHSANEGLGVAIPLFGSV